MTLQVRMVAEIVNTLDQPDKTDVRYMVRDYGCDEQEPFLVIQYFGIEVSLLSFKLF